jgi:transposase
MASKPVAFLLADLGVTKTHSRPHCPNDNPFSEAQFKTLKYRPEFPDRFGSPADARGFCQRFFPWYNDDHRHSALGYHTPADVHYGRAEIVRAGRFDVLTAAYAAHPERFVRKLPEPPAAGPVLDQSPGPGGDAHQVIRPARCLKGVDKFRRHLARFVSELVEEALDLSAIRAAYTEERGYPPYDPRLMLKLLIYGYCTGQRSSRGIERRCQDDVAFRYLAAGAVPDYRSIARFRRRHLQALAGLFLQARRLCQRAGMVRLGKVALDGTKLRANASRHKAMSYQRMVKREAQREAEIDAMLAEAERVDASEDERFGPDGP